MQQPTPPNPATEKKKISYKRLLRRLMLNKYTLTIFIFLIWMVFFDNSSFLVLRELNAEIRKYEEKVQYYKAEYEKNTEYYNRLMQNKDEKERFARENYFMKKRNEEIFIIVTDTLQNGK